MSNGVRSGGNLLLRVLPAQALERVVVEDETYALRTVVTVADRPQRYVYFPNDRAVASIVRMTASGQMVEAGVVGAEGLFNLHAVLGGPPPAGTQAVVQNDGRFTRIEISRMRELFEEHLPFRDAVLAYTSLFLDQVTQNLVCNRLHLIEQRLAKWLLVMHDRVDSDELKLTQEFLSYMLGVHRPGVSIAVNALETDGLIRHRRNWIELVDREGVAARSCECYASLHEKLRGFRQPLATA